MRPIGAALVETVGVGRGDRVLDVGAGTGNAAIPAASAGATVVASDLTSELLEAGRRSAEGEGLDLEWRQADAESLPFADSEFDHVLSAIGVMFAPHHGRSADEPSPPHRPPGHSRPPQWGDEEHMRSLLGDGDTASRRGATPSGGHLRPAGRVPRLLQDQVRPDGRRYRSVGGDAERVAELDAALENFAARSDRGDGDFALEREYLELIARRAAWRPRRGPRRRAVDAPPGRPARGAPSG